ncbi:MAG: hypothetical protein GY711_04305 [bacterium]|nr:hypothetical protein [bacterium]
MRSLSPIVLALAAGCGSSSPGPTVTASEVQVSTSKMDVTLDRKQSFDDTYMIFGGMPTNRDDMFTKITVVGLSMDDARPIYSRYPDFHTCKSAGASLAQQATKQMDIVPASDEVLEQLNETLAAHEESLRSGGDRVCVKLDGDVLQLASATAADQDITGQLPPQLMHDYFLVQSAKIVDAKSALDGR